MSVLKSDHQFSFLGVFTSFTATYKLRKMLEYCLESVVTLIHPCRYKEKEL